MIEKAIEFAVLKHQQQLRKGKQVPYIVHPMEVMQILQAHNCSEKIIIAGILHDTIEDTNTTCKDLKEVFGEEIANLVARESEDKSKTWQERKEKTINSIKSMHEDAVWVLCADKLSNLRGIYNDFVLVGDEAFKVFNAPKEKTKWYYREIINNLLTYHNNPITQNLIHYYQLIFNEKV